MNQPDRTTAMETTCIIATLVNSIRKLEEMLINNLRMITHSTTHIPYNVVSPYLDRRIAPSFLSNNDCIINDQQFEFNTREMPNGRSVRMNGLHYGDTWESLPQQIHPSARPNSEVNTGMRRLPPMKHSTIPKSDPEYIHRTASLPDMIDNRQVNRLSTLRPISKRAYSFYIENLKSLECMFNSSSALNQGKYDTDNVDNSATAVDTSANTDLPIPYAPYDSNDRSDRIGKSEFQLGLFDDHKGSDIPFLDGDLDLFGTDSTREFDSLPDDVIFDDEYVGTRL